MVGRWWEGNEGGGGVGEKKWFWGSGGSEGGGEGGVEEVMEVVAMVR